MILLPVETINRELPGWLFVAYRLASRGNDVVIAQHDLLDILLPHFRGGLYLGKHIFKRLFPDCPLSHYERLKDCGITLVHLDEEGAFYLGSPVDWSRSLDQRIDVNVLRDQDRMCTWGYWQTRYYQSKSADQAGRIVPTGHPRFDLYRAENRAMFADDVARLRGRFGEYVLVNTNFSVANPAIDLQAVFDSVYSEHDEPQAARLDLIERWAQQNRKFAALVKTVQLAANSLPRINFVIRPHPSESLTAYEALRLNAPNIHVIHEGPVNPWILGARAVLHDGCTTAFEATLAEIPVVSFRFGELSRYDQHVPSQLGVPVSNENEAVELLVSIVDRQDYRVPEIPQIVHELVANTQGSALERLLSVIEDVERPENSQARLNGRRVLIDSLPYQALAAARRVFAGVLPNRRLRVSAARQKFYGFSSDYVRRKLDALAALRQETPVRKMITRELIVIYK